MPRPAHRARHRVAAVAVALGAMVGVPAAGATPAAAAANREPFAGSQWNIRQVGADLAWDVSRGRGARVGIIDTGIDLAHPELVGKVVASTRCIGTGGLVARCGGSAQDDSGHGTHVAGIVGAPLDGAGVAGVAPDASLLVVKALQADGSGQAPDVAAGIDWLLSRGANVINLSLAETASSRRAGSALGAAIEKAAGAGAVVVLAGGNQGDAADGTAAFDLPAIVVGATDRNGQLAPYSRPLSTATRWGMVAPGGEGSAGTEGEVVSTYWFPGRRNAYAWSEGTSMAAPHVAGAAALLAAQGVRGQAAVEQLLRTAAAVSCGTGCRGRLDARAAVGAPVPGGAQAASNSPSAVESAPAPAVSPSASVVVPAVPPAPTAPPAAPSGAGSTAGGEVAITPVGPAVALEPASRPRRSNQAPLLAVVAGAGLLAVATATALLSRRQLRADEGW